MVQSLALCPLLPAAVIAVELHQPQAAVRPAPLDTKEFHAEWQSQSQFAVATALELRQPQAESAAKAPVELRQAQAEAAAQPTPVEWQSSQDSQSQILLKLLPPAGSVVDESTGVPLAGLAAFAAGVERWAL